MEKPDSILVPLFDNQEHLLTYEQLSMWLNISVSTLEKYVHRNEIPAVRIGRKALRFLRSDIQQWLQSKKIGVLHGN